MCSVHLVLYDSFSIWNDRLGVVELEPNTEERLSFPAMKARRAGCARNNGWRELLLASTARMTCVDRWRKVGSGWKRLWGHFVWTMFARRTHRLAYIWNASKVDNVAEFRRRRRSQSVLVGVQLFPVAIMVMVFEVAYEKSCGRTDDNPPENRMEESLCLCLSGTRPKWQCPLELTPMLRRFDS